MKFLFLICLAACVFFVFNFAWEIAKRKKEIVVQKFKKVKDVKKITADPRFIEGINFLGGAKKALILLGISFGILIIFGNFIFVLIAGIFYFYTMHNMKMSAIKKRCNKIDKQVIEALTTIKNAVLAGKSIQDAIILTSQDIKEPVKTHFEKMAKDISLGISLDKVLEQAAQNAPSKEFKLMADTIRLSAQSGASISGIFERITDGACARIALQEKITALTAQGKMSGTIVSVVPFLVMLMMALLQPEMMNALFNTFAGNVLLLVVVLMVLVGSFSIKKLTEVDF
jgi:tight adherence protein B